MSQLRRHAVCVSGSGFPPEDQGETANELPFYKVADVAAANSGWLGSPEWTVSRSTALRLRATVFPPGTTILPKIGAALLSNGRAMTRVAACADNNVLALIPGPDMDPRFQYYLTTTLDARRLVLPGPVPSLDVGALRDTQVSLPPLDEQRAIADYLDRETARIDALIAAKERQRQLLTDRVAATIQEAVDASGATTVPLRRLIASFVDYRGATPEKSSSGVPLITATNVTGGRIDLHAGEQFISKDTYTTWMHRGFPEIGDVLLTTEAPLGEVAAIDDPGVALAQRIILLKPNRDRVLPSFLRLSLMSAKVQTDLLSRASGSTVWGIRADRLREVQVPMPDLRDQQHVAELARDAERHASRGVRLIDRQVVLLHERRQALISAAVTGQIKVQVVA